MCFFKKKEKVVEDVYISRERIFGEIVNEMKNLTDSECDKLVLISRKFRDAEKDLSQLVGRVEKREFKVEPNWEDISGEFIELKTDLINEGKKEDE